MTLQKTSTPPVETANVYITDSSEFRSYVHQQVTEAQREVDDIDTEIQNWYALISSRNTRRADLAYKIAIGHAALAVEAPPEPGPPELKLDRPAPVLGEHPNGGTALEEPK